MVGMMGVFMIAAAFRAEWRTPILIYSAVEKAFMVYLVVANVSRPYSQGFWIGATMDATVVLYTIRVFRPVRLWDAGVLLFPRQVMSNSGTHTRTWNQVIQGQGV
jgi:hypothetical protein